MDEFIEFLREMMGEGSPRIKAVQFGNEHILVKETEDIPEEALEGVFSKIREEDPEASIHLVSGICNVDMDHKDEFNDLLDGFLDKHDLTPEEFGIDYNPCGLFFVYKAKFSEASLKGMTKELLDICSVLKGNLRVHFLSSDLEYLGRYEDVANGVGSKARNELAPAPGVRPSNRGVIQESEIADLKIALNSAEEKDCLEILEEIMRIGG